MNWDTERIKLGREPAIIVEAELDYCSRTYGVGACTAAVGVTGDAKCFNTRSTCQVPAAYDVEAKVYRWSNVELDPSLPHIPNLRAAAFSSTKIDPGKSLGQRGTVVLTFQDGPWADRDVDKYWSGRGYDPEAHGSYWGKLLARNKFYQNRVIRVYSGYLTTPVDLANFECRTYFINKITGPDAKGVVKVHCVDIFRFADNLKVKVSPLSGGSVLAAFTTADTNFTLTPVGVGDLEYPASGRIAIGEEVIDFSRVGDVMTMNARGVLDSQFMDHDADEQVQLCKVWNDVFILDILYELLVDYVGVDPAYIDLPTWTVEAETWLSGYFLTATIAEPTGVLDLLNEICETCLCYMWWAEEVPTILFKAIHPEDPNDPTRELTDAYAMLANSMSISEEPEQRISEIVVRYARVNPLLKLDEWRNYAQAIDILDASARSSEEYGEDRIRTIYSRFLSADNLAEASVLANRLIARYRDNPRKFSFKLDAKDCDLRVGDVVLVNSDSLQGADGFAKITSMQILSRTEVIAGTTYAYELTDTFFFGRYAWVMDDATPDYSAATEVQKAKGCFVCDSVTLKMPNGDPPYKVP